ncbi:MAG TPA: prefoldin subunit beta [Thermoplasmata archaeon]|nr:prefoldin subunit beta [Thermoplasmata archaeon]
MALPAKLQNDIKQFQRLQQELSQYTQQRIQMDLKLRETVQTLDALSKIPAESTVYRPVGGLLVRAKDRKEVEDLLSEEKETLEVRVKALERQENHLKDRYTQMQKELSEAIQAAGVTPEGRSSGT